MSGDNAYLGLAPDSAEGKVISTLDQNIVFRVEVSFSVTMEPNLFSGYSFDAHNLVYIPAKQSEANPKLDLRA